MTFQNLHHIQYGNRHQMRGRYLPGFKKSALILRKKSKQTWPVKLLLSMGTATYRKHELQHMSLGNCYSTSSVRISIFRDITTLISDTLSCVCGQFFIDQILQPWLGAFKYILPLFQYFDGHCSIFDGHCSIFLIWNTVSSIISLIKTNTKQLVNKEKYK